VVLAIALAALTVVTAGLTWALRLYALRHGVLDVPNGRSSHVMPMPRGGGIAIVTGFLTAVALVGARGGLELPAVVAFLGAGLLVAAVGFLDDHSQVVPRWRWRLAAHFAAGAWALAWLGGLPPLLVFGSVWDLGWAGHMLAVVYLAWLLNLYNFMDGIDGIAGVEAVTVCGAAVLLYFLNPAHGLEWLVPATLACATLGFLIWNWPPARIFLGDAGSGFLGMMLGVMSVQAAWVGSELFWSWIILLAVFVVDATVTLTRRLWRGELFYEAHRNHAYQQVAMRCGSHRPVTIAVAGINLAWLLPLALLVGRGLLDGVAGVVLAYVPLLGLAFWLRAGAAPATAKDLSGSRANPGIAAISAAEIPEK
jgi:Fuc2NAc and GlcNAc transferase